MDLSNPETREQRRHKYVREKIARVLGASPSSIDPDRPLTELGLDSLIAVELMTALRIDIGLELPVVKLLQGITMNGLASLALERTPGSASEAVAALPQPEAVSMAVGYQPDPVKLRRCRRLPLRCR